MLCIYCKIHRAILLQWKWIVNDHWTTRVLKALPAKGIHKNWKVFSPNISFQVEFYWYQTSVCGNISILHYRGTNHPKSRVQVHPVMGHSVQFHCVCFRYSTVSKKETIYTRCHLNWYIFQVISSLLQVSCLIVIFDLAWFWIHTVSAPITSGTHTDGGAVIRKPGSTWVEGTPAISIILIFLFYLCCFEEDIRIYRYTNKRWIGNTHEQEQIYFEL